MASHPEPAFPGPSQAETERPINEGMSLRDYFAGKVMQGFLAGPANDCPVKITDVAEWAYATADAMLVVRQGSTVTATKTP